MAEIDFEVQENTKENHTSHNLLKQRQVKKLEEEDSSATFKKRREIRNDSTYDKTSDSVTRSRQIVKSSNSAISESKTPETNVNLDIKTPTPDKTNKKLTFDNQSNVDSNEKNNNLTNNNTNYSAIPRSIDTKVPTDKNGDVLMYWYDCIEENMKGDPNVIFFGKVFEPMSKTFQSISLVIKKMPRTLYVFPKLEKLRDENFTKNQIFDEFEALRKQKFSYIKEYKTKFVKRKYCFELPIPKGTLI